MLTKDDLDRTLSLRGRSGRVEHAIAAFVRTSRDGLIVTGSALTVFHRDRIVTLAARYKLPTVYFQRTFVTSGGLIS